MKLQNLFALSALSLWGADGRTACSQKVLSSPCRESDPLYAGAIPDSENPLVVTEMPDHVRPYVLRHLTGTTVAVGATIFRLLVTGASSDSKLSLLSIYGSGGPRIATHYHTRFFETFFCVKGRVRAWENNAGRELIAGDFGAAPPTTFHSFQLLEPDTHLAAFIAPAGLDRFFMTVGESWNSTSGSSFSPDAPRPFPDDKFNGEASRFDVNIDEGYFLNYDLTNATTEDGQTSWHQSSNALLGKPRSYYIANNWGPKYLERSLGQIVQPLATRAKSDGNMTLATITLRQRLPHDDVKLLKFLDSQAFQVLEGLFTVSLNGTNTTLAGGDVVFIPAKTEFRYWSSAKFTKVYLGTAGRGLDSWLLERAEKWDHAVFPAEM
ncbi:quercetin 2,3-dioxygenase [Beauveria bassiana ARSEF 2860]|uniref:Quercetin 2,3-dioxygenase n=1 Tax=Beauveria bassiana (strain ARSEF 2860) TaxID=655819 RepID=J5J5W4_BEAB2|nr:quercetin 2,3-dioxygenase [Beauveria bassiana ARSEF 2860]EJP61948.1 quercetin 2,3-dioxygenase [Beauveria bassiana ARSEF 2860]